MNKDKLITLIIKKQTYKDTKEIQNAVHSLKDNAIKISTEAIIEILTTQYNAQAKLYSVRFLKDCFEKGSSKFIDKTQKQILPLLQKIITDDLQPQGYMKYAGSYTKKQQLKKFKDVVISLYEISKECVKNWAQWIPDQSHQFLSTYQRLKKKGVKFNENKYFRPQNKNNFMENCRKNNVKINVSASAVEAKPVDIKKTGKKKTKKDEISQLLLEATTLLNKSKISQSQFTAIQNKFNNLINQFIEINAEFDQQFFEKCIEEFEEFRQRVQQKNTKIKAKEQTEHETPNPNSRVENNKSQAKKNNQLNKPNQKNSYKQSAPGQKKQSSELKIQSKSKILAINVDQISQIDHRQQSPFSVTSPLRNLAQRAKNQSYESEISKFSQASLSKPITSKQEIKSKQSIKSNKQNFINKPQYQIQENKGKSGLFNKSITSKQQIKSKQSMQQNKGYTQNKGSSFMKKTQPQRQTTSKQESRVHFDPESQSQNYEDEIQQENTHHQINTYNIKPAYKSGAPQPKINKYIKANNETIKEQFQQSSIGDSQLSSKPQKNVSKNQKSRFENMSKSDNINEQLKHKLDEISKKYENLLNNVDRLEREKKQHERQLNKMREQENKILEKLRISSQNEQYHKIKNQLYQEKKQKVLLQQQINELRQEMIRFASQKRKDQSSAERFKQQNQVPTFQPIKQSPKISVFSVHERKAQVTRIDPDYVENLTHFNNLQYWLNPLNITLLKQNILGTNSTFYQDENFMIQNKRSLSSRNSHTFLNLELGFWSKTDNGKIDKIKYENIQQIDLWFKPIKNTVNGSMQELVAKRCGNPLSLIKGLIHFTNKSSTTILLPFCYFNFLQSEQFELYQFNDIMTSKPQQIHKSTIFHIDNKYIKNLSDFGKIFPYSTVDGRFINFCLKEPLKQEVFMVQIQLLKNQKVVVRVLPIPYTVEMNILAKQLLQNLMFLLGVVY